MKEKDFTKKDLELAANDLSKVMEFELPIETGKKTTIKQLKEDLIEAAKELREDDDILDDTKTILTLLGAVLPFEEEEAAAAEEEEEEEKEQPKRKIGVANPEITKRNKFIESLIAKGKFTQVEIVEKTLEKFPDHKKGGIATSISDGKNPKYNKFSKLVKTGKDKLLSF